MSLDFLQSIEQKIYKETGIKSPIKTIVLDDRFFDKVFDELSFMRVTRLPEHLPDELQYRTACSDIRVLKEKRFKELLREKLGHWRCVDVDHEAGDVTLEYVKE